MICAPYVVESNHVTGTHTDILICTFTVHIFIGNEKTTALKVILAVAIKYNVSPKWNITLLLMAKAAPLRTLLKFYRDLVNASKYDH